MAAHYLHRSVLAQLESKSPQFLSSDIAGPNFAVNVTPDIP